MIGLILPQRYKETNGSLRFSTKLCPYCPACFTRYYITIVTSTKLYFCISNHDKRKYISGYYVDDNDKITFHWYKIHYEIAGVPVIDGFAITSRRNGFGIGRYMYILETMMQVIKSRRGYYCTIK